MEYATEGAGPDERSNLAAPAAAEGTTGEHTGVFAVAQGVRAVHEHVAHAPGVAVRIVVGRRVDERLRIEDDNVREPALTYPSAPVDPQAFGGQPRHPVDSLGERCEAEVAAVVAEEPRERAVAARMRSLALRAFRHGRARCVGADRDPRPTDRLADVVLVDHEVHTPGVEARDEVERRIDRLA